MPCLRAALLQSLRRSLLLIFCSTLPLLAVLLSTIAAADEPPTSIDPPELAGATFDEEDESGVTSATVRTTARAPMPEFMAPRSVDAIDEEELTRRQPQSLADALSEETGVFRQATNRGADSVYLRGLIGPENVIVIDGVRFNQSTFRTGPNQYLATLDPHGFERLEVVRGPGSVLYGSGAMGGVIQGFTRSFRDEPGVSSRTMATYGSSSHIVGGTGDLDGRRGRVAGNVGLSYREVGPLNYGRRGGDDLFLSAAQQGQMLASDYRQIFWRTGAKADLGEGARLEVRYLAGVIDGMHRTDQLGRGQMRTIDNRDDLVWSRLHLDDLAGFDEASAFAAFHRTDEQTRRYQCEIDDRGQTARVADLLGCASLSDHTIRERRDLRDTTHTVGVGVEGRRMWPFGLEVIVGAEGYHDHVNSMGSLRSGPDFDQEIVARGNFSDGSTYATVGAFSHGELSLWHSGLHEIGLHGGGRVEHFRARAPEVTDELGDVSFENTGLVGALGVSYLYGTNVHLYLNWNQGFRAPNLQESTVLGDTGNSYEVPNPDLGPERNDTFELGGRLNLGGLGTLSTSLFTSLMRDRITRVPTEFNGEATIDEKPVEHRINADRAYYYGLEVGVQSAPIGGFSVYGNLAWIDGAVQSEAADPFFEAGPLHELFAGDAHWTAPRRLPPLQGLVGIRFDPDRDWSIAIYGIGNRRQTKLSSGDRGDLRICEIAPGVLEQPERCAGTPGWATLNLRGTYHPNEVLRLDLQATNLIDQHYQSHGSGLFGPGMQVLGTATLNY